MGARNPARMRVAATGASGRHRGTWRSCGRRCGLRDAARRPGPRGGSSCRCPPVPRRPRGRPPGDPASVATALVLRRVRSSGEPSPRSFPAPPQGERRAIGALAVAQRRRSDAGTLDRAHPSKVLRPHALPVRLYLALLGQGCRALERDDEPDRVAGLWLAWASLAAIIASILILVLGLLSVCVHERRRPAGRRLRPEARPPQDRGPELRAR